MELEGLTSPVRILTDPWGVSHIYADNQNDLFFAQGFNAARDRLFQLEMWRRRATDTWSEVLGPEALDSDIGARLLRLRQPIEEELRHYHPQGPEIIGSFVRGINAYIEETRRNPEWLPLEFRLLGLQPGLWTPEVVVSRHNGLFRNAGDEVRLARLVRRLGAPKVMELLRFVPSDPRLEAAPGLDLSLIDPEVLELYRASRGSPEFRPQHIVDEALRAQLPPRLRIASRGLGDPFDLGSNNWVIAPHRTFSGRPYMANDPHRRQQIPSLRYFVHLSAPGWDVIGGGEPALPGVSIGHNRHGAWGLTIFSIDQEDLYVYETDPEDTLRYRYKDGWERMRVESETVPVRGQPAETIELRFTRHGPVLHQDLENHRAYALRAAWLEIGTSPYLPSLRFDQARTWEEFRQACAFFLAPSENMIWADRDGNIGWQATGITPLRPNWDGLLPVPGDGRFEWAGYLPVLELPSVFNPPAGHFSSANQNNLPSGYPHRIGFRWTEPFRYGRIEEVLGSKKLLGLGDMKALQHDEYSIPARQLVPLLKGVSSTRPLVGQALSMLLAWDRVLAADSAAAAVYSLWERHLAEEVQKLLVPDPETRELARRLPIGNLIRFLHAPDARLGEDPVEERGNLLISCLGAAVDELAGRFESRDPKDWRYGDARLHHNQLRHPLSEAVNRETRRKLDIGPFPRGGNSFTVNNTNSSDNQTSGASFRVIVDVGEWDRSVATNHPGQSGDPDSPHYRDLAAGWSANRYFPLLYSKARVEAAARLLLTLRPKGHSE